MGLILLALMLCPSGGIWANERPQMLDIAVGGFDGPSYSVTLTNGVLAYRSGGSMSLLALGDKAGDSLTDRFRMESVQNLARLDRGLELEDKLRGPERTGWYGMACHSEVWLEGR